MRKVTLPIILIGLLSACSHDRSQYIKETTLVETVNVRATVDTIRILLDSIGLNSYIDFSYFITSDKEYFLGRNNSGKCFDLFDLTSRKFVTHIFLKDENDLIADVKAVKAIDFDNILVMLRGKLLTIDSSGVIKQTIDLYKIMGADFERLGDPAVHNHFPLNYLPSEQGGTTLFYSHRSTSNYVGKDVVLEFDHNANKLTLLPIKYSPYYSDKDGYLGYLTYINFGDATIDYIYYNFAYESNLYRFNRHNQQSEVFGGEVHGVRPLATALESPNEDQQQWTTHAIENAHYFRPLYDQFRHLIYRPVWKDIKYEREDSYFNDFIDKNLVISVFDDHGMKPIANHTLPPMRYAIHKWFVSKDGLALSPTHPENKNVKKNTLELHVFRFEN
ncbi:DUF4221 domain-containing protein [Dawidia soli]|uniref:DUF4221 domain-containing protein n=1 Tax=Dawidia soli TaxID=2782352 RepID=A0AAP2GLS0_9BACT|nr:DUF4221 domain-containing protein [Dawidia soli]MBT1690800.1 hypothetical protein [Dawidia soli]